MRVYRTMWNLKPANLKLVAENAGDVAWINKIDRFFRGDKAETDFIEVKE